MIKAIKRYRNLDAQSDDYVIGTNDCDIVNGVYLVAVGLLWIVSNAYCNHKNMH